MIATSISSLRSVVIRLLREDGRTPIEAVELWDRVYSRQIQTAKPGTHKLLIGKYTLEYTKPGAPSPIDLTELIATSNAEAHKAEISHRLRRRIQALAVIVLVIAGYIYFF